MKPVELREVIYNMFTKISVRISYSLISWDWGSVFVTKPIATPATGLDKGTPASIRARLPPQTDAIDEEPIQNISKPIKRKSTILLRSELH